MRRWLAGMVVAVCLAGLGAAMFDAHKAERAVRFFEMLRHTKGRFRGQPFLLLPWEKKIVREVYGRVNERGLRTIKMVYIEVPKKNGKSEIAAGAALYHLFADGEQSGEVYGCAADRSQASLVFDVAVDMIDQAPALQKRVKLQASHKRITDRRSGSYYQVLSAESYTKHGLNVSACVFDELHAQPNRDLWDVMTFGAGDARLQPIWWVITTAGDDPDRVSICWEQHEYALKVLSGDVVDPTFYPVIFGYEGEDIYNEANWRKANPSLGTTITLESVREAASKAKEKPAEERLFRWLRLNQWLTTKLTTWLDLSLYDRNEGKWSRDELIGLECYMGLDLSSTTDLTALVLLFPPQGEMAEWRTIYEAWIPEENMKDRVRNDHVPYDRWAKRSYINVTEGNVVDYTKVEARILELAKPYHVKEVCCDRSFAAMLIQRLEQQGLTCVDIPQTFAQMTDPLQQIERLLKEKKFSHEKNPVARWCYGNASVAVNGNGQIKLVKEHKGRNVDRTKRIDLVAATADAMARARFYGGSVDISAQILDPEWGL